MSNDTHPLRHRTALVTGAVAAAALIAGGYGLYRIGVMHGARISAPAGAGNGPQKAGDLDPATGRKVLYWHDPMVPGQRFERPGKSPFMDMALVPVYEGAGDTGGIQVSPRIQQSLGIRTAAEARGALAPRVEVVGNVAFNERDQVIVQARATAYVEKLHVRATLDRVKAGQPLADLYVPAWVAVQEEFLVVRRMRGTDIDTLADAARQRMYQAGMTTDQVRGVEDSGEVAPRSTLRAPVDGVVVELGTREGMTVMPGDTLFRISGLDTVWANAAVPETQAALLRPGASVEARSPALPNVAFAGSVQAILPDVDPTTRTVTTRVELANRDRQLVPGMFMNMTIATPARDALTVPTEAVIATGERTVVIRAESGGTFAPVDVRVGLEANGETEITSGLAAGDQVVVSGQFLLDSEASLRATSTRMAAPSTPPATPTSHVGVGTIRSVEGDRVTLSHGPIPSLDWGAMTMQFKLPPGNENATLAVGATVRFTFVMDADGQQRISAAIIARAPARARSP